MNPRIEYEVCTAYGRPIKTFDTRKAATKHAADVAPIFPRCEVYEVQYPAPIRRRIWREQVRLVAGAAS